VIRVPKRKRRGRFAAGWLKSQRYMEEGREKEKNTD